MAARLEKIDSSSVYESLLERSPEGSYYVVDEDANGLYEIEAFIGDVTPICQVYAAKFSTGQNIEEILGEHRGDEIHQEVVALKLARIDNQSSDFINMRQEVENSLKIGPNDDQENDIITENSIIVGIYRSFEYRGFFCVSMPYMKEGSLRYIINSTLPGRKLRDEKCVAVVLRKVLDGLCFLHGREKVHTKLNAGNIFLKDFVGPETVKLGYQGSNYFHDHNVDSPLKIWDEMLESAQIKFFCLVSESPENQFWTIQRIYEPSRDDQNQNYTAESDIWNFGVTALELAFGPLHTYRGKMRSPDELRAFLMNLCNNEEIGLPKLHDLFIPEVDQQTLRKIEYTTSTTPEENIAKRIAGKMIRKAKSKFALCVNPKADEDQFLPELMPDERVSSLFKEMVKKCLVVDPNERPTAQALLDDPFFREHQNVNMEYLAEWVLPYYDTIRFIELFGSVSDSEADC